MHPLLVRFLLFYNQTRSFHYLPPLLCRCETSLSPLLHRHPQALSDLLHSLQQHLRPRQITGYHSDRQAKNWQSQKYTATVAMERRMAVASPNRHHPLFLKELLRILPLRLPPLLPPPPPPPQARIPRCPSIPSLCP